MTKDNGFSWPILGCTLPLPLSTFSVSEFCDPE